MADLQDISTVMTEISLERNNIRDLPPFTGDRSTRFPKTLKRLLSFPEINIFYKY